MDLTRREWLTLSAGTVAGLALRLQDPSPALEQIVRSGTPSTRVNLIFASEGFDSRGMRRYDAIVADLTRQLLKNEIFSTYANFLNVFKASPVSQRSWNGTGKGTHFGVRIGRSKNDLVVDWKQVPLRLPRLPERNVVALIVQNAEAMRAKGGGSALEGRLATGSTPLVFFHELGHALGLLGDEYIDGGALHPRLTLNVTEDRREIPWTPMLRRRIPGTGVYQVEGQERTFWKGEEQCVMAQNHGSFGPVCRWGMVMGIHRHSRLIEPITPPHVVLTPDQAPRLTARFNSPKGHPVRFRFVTRPVKDERGLAAAAYLTAKNVTEEMLTLRKGWLPVEPIRDMNGVSIRVPSLGVGHHIVLAYAKDTHPWIAADPEGDARDVVAWRVKVPR